MMRDILRFKLIEEYRMHATYSSPRFFLVCPLFVYMASAFTALVLGRYEGLVEMDELVTFVHVGALIYGMSVGAIGLLGSMLANRSGGRSNLMFILHQTLPIPLRSMYMALYLNDVVFYTALMILPATAGLLVTIPFTGFSAASVALAMGALFLSFMFGMSSSFLASMVYVRVRTVFLVLVSGLILALVLATVTGVADIGTLLPTLSLATHIAPYPWSPEAMVDLVVSVVIIAVFSVFGIMGMGETAEVRTRVRGGLYHRVDDRLAWAGRYRHLVAKEITDFIRSGALGKMLFAFALPLVILGLTIYYLDGILGLPLGLNVVFYATMAGFFGISSYNLIVNTDTMDYFETLPVDVPQAINAKLIAFLLLTTGISTMTITAIASLNGESGMLWVALPVLYVTTLYMVISTAYLTGLNPNSALFDPGVLIRFYGIAFLPNLCLTILSMTIPVGGTDAIAGIALVLVALLVGAILFHRGIRRRWGGTAFP